jgi:hypothetical protein
MIKIIQKIIQYLLQSIEKVILIFDKYYYVALFVISLVFIWLNWDAQGMQGIIPFYRDFKTIILNGFDSSFAQAPTFPMWGYGWLMILTENKLLILIIQNVLAIISVVCFFDILKISKVINPLSLIFLKIALLISIPWYAFNSLRWPYSPAISFFTISFALLTDQLSLLYEKKISKRRHIQYRTIILSGLCLGITLNFRSDYYLLPILIFGIIMIYYKFQFKIFKLMCIWIISIYTLLLPWSLYTHKITGHYSITSTNAGAAQLIGMGSLPNNIWGILPSDGDPLAHTILQNRMGDDKYSFIQYVHYEGSEILKSEFIKRVTSNPQEYLRKLLNSFEQTLNNGVYIGEFHQRINCPDGSSCPGNNPRKQAEYEILNELIPNLINNASFSSKQVVRINYFIFIGTLITAIMTSNITLILLLSTIFYQMLVGLIAFSPSSVSTNLYVFYLVNISYAVHIAWELSKFVRYQIKNKIDVRLEN